MRKCFNAFLPCSLVDDQMSDDEDTETSASTLPRPKSATEGSAFDENSLNQPQFIHLLEKFLGDVPIKYVRNRTSFWVLSIRIPNGVDF